MEQTETPIRTRSTTTLVLVSACAVLLAGAFLYLWLGGTKSVPTTNAPLPQENAPLLVRESLAKKDDLITCQNAIDQLNTYYSQSGREHPATLNTEAQDALARLCGLEPDEIADIAGDRFTALDASYLDQCFLMRDAARSLETEVRGRDSAALRLTPLEQAASAFAWVVRQMRLQDGLFSELPPQFALRRGWGTPMDRALIFLSLLPQFGMSENARAKAGPDLLGCLVMVPDKDGPRLWACGVLVGEEKKLYLFDPRLGLPLPGPNGHGIATLAEVQKDPTLLTPLTIKSAPAYDVTPEMVKKAEIRLYCPLSALAPRLRTLQDKILPPMVRVHLAQDMVQNEQKFKQAVGAETPVKVAKLEMVFLRVFLPKEKGGINEEQPFFLRELRRFVEPNDPVRVKLSWEKVYTFELAPWYELPAVLRDQGRFPFNIGLGQTVRMRFLEPFRSFTQEAEAGRDQMLRGHYRPALKQLSQEREECGNYVKELNKLAGDPQLKGNFDKWLDKAEKVYAQQLRARAPAEVERSAKEIEALWGEEPMATLLPGFVARARRPEATYYLALCKHELAEQAQARLDLTARSKGAAPVQAKEWADAVEWWQRFVEDYPNAPEREAARRLHGQAQLMAGDREAALKIWETDVPANPVHPLEKLACLYLAEQARKK